MSLFPEFVTDISYCTIEVRREYLSQKAADDSASCIFRPSVLGGVPFDSPARSLSFLTEKESCYYEKIQTQSKPYTFNPQRQNTGAVFHWIYGRGVHLGGAVIWYCYGRRLRKPGCDLS